MLGYLSFQHKTLIPTVTELERAISEVKLAFIIDKTQTFQIIANQLFESLNRGHECTLFCVFLPHEMGDFLSDASLTRGIKIEDALSTHQLKWEHSGDKSRIIKVVCNNGHLYDAIVGINLFNPSWKSLYEKHGDKCYSLEYCWNEIYNQNSTLKSSAKLLCNTTQSKAIISELSTYGNLDCLGSPWFEFLMKSKSHKENLITILAPHNSVVSHGSELLDGFGHLVNSVREWCTENSYMLVLKTRKKYNANFLGDARFDAVVSDTNAFEHIKLYSSSSVVIHFCSSAINELTFLQIPSIALCNDVQKRLHVGKRHHPGILKLHEMYYSGSIFDGIHYDGCESPEMLTSLPIEKLEKLLSSKKSWSTFQDKYFSGHHSEASSRIADLIESENA